MIPKYGTIYYIREMEFLVAINNNSINQFEREQLIINVLKECYYLNKNKFNSEAYISTFNNY